MKFNPEAGQARIEAFWKLRAEFGVEREARDVYLDDIISDRYSLVRGMQLVRDELQALLKRIDALRALLGTLGTTGAGASE